MLDQRKLKELLHYNQETGVFTWRAGGRNRRVGGVAGSKCSYHGYRRHLLLGNEYRAADLAWLYVTGEWPPTGFIVDHKDGSRTNDAFNNLRLATQSQNCMNKRMQSNNSSGCRGVSWHIHNAKWIGRIQVAGKSVYLGQFETIFDAAGAVISAQNQLHGEFSITNRYKQLLASGART